METGKFAIGESGKLEMDVQEKEIEEENSGISEMMGGQERDRISNACNTKFEDERDEFTDSYFETIDKLLKSKHCKWNRSDSYLSRENSFRDFQIGIKPKPECYRITTASQNRGLESIGSIYSGSLMQLSGSSTRGFKGTETRLSITSPLLTSEEDNASRNHERRFTKDSIYAWSTSTPDPRTFESPTDR